MAVEEQEAGAAQGRRQLLAGAEEQPVQQGRLTVAAFPRTTPGWIKCPQQHRELLITSSSTAEAGGPWLL